MMKKVLSLVISLLVMLSVSNEVFAFSAEGEMSSNERIRQVAIEFVEKEFSDFSDSNDVKSSVVDSKAEGLKKHMLDRKEIKAYKEKLIGRKLTLKSFKAPDEQLVPVNENTEDVLLKIQYNYWDGDLESKLIADYKIRVTRDNDDFYVYAAISNDLSDGTLFPENLTLEAKELPLDSQINSSAMNKERAFSMGNSSIDSAKDRFAEYIKSIEFEKELNDQSAIRPMSGRFAYFSSQQKANMRRYQDNYFNGFNSAYYNFTGRGGDCTNYASQILRAGGAPFKSSSSSSITGSNYWYYRSINERSSSWAGVNELRTFLVNNSSQGPVGYFSSTFGALDTGSIIQLKNDRGRYYHSVVVYKKGGDPWVTAHSSSYSGYFSSRWGGIDNVKIRIDGYYY